MSEPIPTPVCVLALVGPTGSGKTTLQNELLTRFPGRYTRLVGCTTRPPRPGEVDGVDYHFVTPEVFESEPFFEKATVHGYLKGVRQADVDALAASGKVAVVVLDAVGVRAYQEKLSSHNLLSVYVLGPSESERKRRAIERGDSPESFEKRVGADRESAKDALGLRADALPLVEYALPGEFSPVESANIVDILVTLHRFRIESMLAGATEDLQ